MSASPDDIGSLAAKAAKLILDKDISPKAVGIIPPLPTKLYCNVKSLQKFQASITQRALEEYNGLPDVWQATVVTP